MRKMYSKKQIEGMAKSVANSEIASVVDSENEEFVDEVLASLQNEDVKAKTLEQSEANITIDITTPITITGATSELIFGRIQRINGELHIIYIGKVTNNTEETITGYGTQYLQIELPTEIADRLVAVDGKKASASDGNNQRISGTYASVFKDTMGINMATALTQVQFFITNPSSANKINLSFNSRDNFNLASGSTIYFEGRVSLDLL